MDSVIGVAVLDITNDVHTLYLAVRRSTNTYNRYTSLPVYPAGTAKPKDVNDGHVWAYTVKSKILFLSPSLRIGYINSNHEFVEEFHNQSNWAVPFEYAVPYPGEKVCNGEDCYVQFCNLNPGIKF